MYMKCKKHKMTDSHFMKGGDYIVVLGVGGDYTTML
jgi:hypothetical protein